MLSLAVAAAPVSAASAGLTDSLTVISSLGITLSTSSIDYGNVAMGLESQRVPVQVVIDGHTDWVFYMSGSAFVNENNTASLPASIRWARITDYPSSTNGAPFPVNGTGVAQGFQPTGFIVEQWVSLAGLNIPAGTYTGTTTYSVVQL